MASLWGLETLLESKPPGWRCFQGFIIVIGTQTAGTLDSLLTELELKVLLGSIILCERYYLKEAQYTIL